MKIALVGTGNMGQAVETLAEERGHEIVARFDSSHPLAEANDLRSAEVAIDFSVPNVAIDHLRWYCEHGQPAVIGTTGWYDDLDTVRGWVDEHDAAILYAPNFSIGVALLVQALQHLAPLLDALPEYDAAIHEVHHTKKLDSPSGTAGMIAEVLLNGIDRKTHIETETQHGRIDPAALHVSSTRLGSVFGQHTVTLDSDFDQITLAHAAKNRRGFAFGAIKAAEWLPGRQGLFTLDDMLSL